MDYREPEWVAEKLGLDRNTVYKFLHDGTIPAVQLGRKWLVSEKRLAEWLEAETERQTRARLDATRSSERTVRRMDSFAPDAQDAIRAAHSAARGYNHHYLGQEHLLLALAADVNSPAGRVMREIGLTPEEVKRGVESRVQPGDTPPPRRLGRTDRCKRAMRLAERRAREQGRGLVNSLDLLWGIAVCAEGVGYEILQERGITADSIIAAAKEDQPERKQDHGSE